MAALSKHGEELARIEGLTTRKAYMSDGTVLKNIGFGWKIGAKVRPGFDVREVARRALEIHATMPDRMPARYAFQSFFHDNAPFGQRWKVKSALDMMPDDIDGVWATLDDDYQTRGLLSVDDVRKLAELNRAAIEEQKHRKGQTADC